MVSFVTSLFTALSSIAAIAKYVEEFASAVSIWYINRQQTDTLAKIADAAALASRAKTQEERLAAAEKWQDVLSRPRVTS